MAVFPTPGSPTSRGLFFRRRQRTCIIRSSSRARPIKGSMLSCSANSAKLTVNCSRTSSLPFCCFLSEAGVPGLGAGSFGYFPGYCERYIPPPPSCRPLHSRENTPRENPVPQRWTPAHHQCPPLFCRNSAHD